VTSIGMLSRSLVTPSRTGPRGLNLLCGSGRCLVRQGGARGGDGPPRRYQKLKIEPAERGKNSVPVFVELLRDAEERVENGVRVHGLTGPQWAEKGEGS